MKRYLILFVLLMCSTISYSQLIGEGDTLWAKSGLPTIRQVQFSPDGTKLAVLSADAVGKLTMFDSETGKELWTVPKETYYFYQFSYSLDGSKIYTLPPAEKQINIIDINTGVILDSLPVEISLKMKENESDNYSSVYQTKNQNILLIGNASGCYALYDMSKRQIIKERFGYYKNKFFASPNSDYFIDVHQAKNENKWIARIVLMDINTLNIVAVLGEQTNAPFEIGGDIKISYNGKYAATNFGTSTLQIWDLDNKKIFKEYLPSIDRGGPQSTLAFSHDNELIINSGGYYKDFKLGLVSITNLINDKRAIIFENNNFGSIDINIDDTKFAASRAGTVFVFRLKKDAVPVRETPSEIDSIIYPNPTTGGNIIVNIPESIGLINKGQLFDNTGKIIKNYLPHKLQTTNSKLILNINDLNNGLYILRLTTNNNVLTYKIVLEK